MEKCPFPHAVRGDLPPLTKRIAKLPVSERGYPVPFFVEWIDGKPDFRIMDTAKFARCCKESLCWVCGEKLGAYVAFVLGPMCTVNRISAEPPAHKDCCEWSVRGCPFLTKPQMKRREDELTQSADENVSPGFIKENPGAVCVWTTRKFGRTPGGNGTSLFTVGEPESASWWHEGRPATREEVIDAMKAGLPRLFAGCQNKKDVAEVNWNAKRALAFIPK